MRDSVLVDLLHRHHLHWVFIIQEEVSDSAPQILVLLMFLRTLGYWRLSGVHQRLSPSHYSKYRSCAFQFGDLPQTLVKFLIWSSFWVQDWRLVWLG